MSQNGILLSSTMVQARTSQTHQHNRKGRSSNQIILYTGIVGNQTNYLQILNCDRSVVPNPCSAQLIGCRYFFQWKCEENINSLCIKHKTGSNLLTFYCWYILMNNTNCFTKLHSVKVLLWGISRDFTALHQQDFFSIGTSALPCKLTYIEKNTIFIDNEPLLLW